MNLYVTSHNIQLLVPFISLTGKSTRTVWCTVYPKRHAHGFCFAVLCCGYSLTDFPISIRLTSLALWQSSDCPSASKATLINMDKYFIWIHYERLHNHNKAKHNKTVCIFFGIYCNLAALLWYVKCVYQCVCLDGRNSRSLTSRSNAIQSSILQYRW